MDDLSVQQSICGLTKRLKCGTVLNTNTRGNSETDKNAYNYEIVTHLFQDEPR